MPDILLYNRRGSATAKVLAKELKMRAIRDDRMQGIFNSPPKIRWGTSVTVFGDTTTLNSQDSIANSAHGLRMLRRLAESGIHCPTPRSYIEFENEPEELPVKYLARKNNHRGGTDIREITTRHQLAVAHHQGSYAFYVPFVETSMELRVHIFDGQVLKAFILTLMLRTFAVAIEVGSLGAWISKVTIPKLYRLP
jgi:hypothetical protein